MSGGAATGRVSAVCVTHAVVPAGPHTAATGIDKRPVTGPVAVGPLGLAGDTIVDRRHHGGPDQALYAYSDEDADRWVADLEREIPPGLFGENLRVGGTDASGAVIGERWQRVVSRPRHGVTIAHWWAHQQDAGVAAALLAAHGSGEVRLQDELRGLATRALARA